MSSSQIGPAHVPQGNELAIDKSMAHAMLCQTKLAFYTENYVSIKKENFIE